MAFWNIFGIHGVVGQHRKMSSRFKKSTGFKYDLFWIKLMLTITETVKAEQASNGLSSHAWLKEKNPYHVCLVSFMF